MTEDVSTILFCKYLLSYFIPIHLRYDGIARSFRSRILDPKLMSLVCYYFFVHDEHRLTLIVPC